VIFVINLVGLGTKEKVQHTILRLNINFKTGEFLPYVVENDLFCEIVFFPSSEVTTVILAVQ